MPESEHQLPDARPRTSTDSIGARTTLVMCCSTPVLARSCAVAIALGLSIGDARALDLDNEVGIMTSTVASRERLKDFDNIKKYGAERVVDRDRRYLLPDGLRMGNFLLFPSVGTSATYDDNIFASAFDPEADWRMEIAPMLVLQSQLPRHEINVVLGAKSVSFLENSDQDYVNLNALLRGALHIDHAHTLSAAFTSSLEHEERNEITAPQSAAEPVPVFRNRFSAGITRDVGRLYGTLSGMVESLDYGNVEALDGSILNQDMRDQLLFSGQIRAGYRISPGFEIVGKIKVLRQQNGGDTVSDRDSIGYEAMAGLAMESSPLLRWQLLGGYGIRDYDRADFANISSVLIEGRVEWLPTQRMTVYGTIQHAIDDTLGAADSGRIETSIEGRVEYEIYHNLVGRAGLEVSQAEFIGSDRSDLTLEAGIGLDYYYTKNWLFTFDYKFQDRLSSEDEFESTRNQFRVGAKLRF